MASSGGSSRDITISDPDSITSNDLLNLSLTQLSKMLPQTTSSRSTMFIYLRWLEVHRQEPSKCTDHWQNTLLHWTQSLRSRGFRESEIVAKVDDWKETNGPFRSKWCRYPPMKDDIAKAFDEMKTRVVERMERGIDRDLVERIDRFGDSYRPSDSIYGPDDSPTRSRSDGVRGKIKKRTPENYDGKPPPNYVCNRCGQKGHHLQVCPTNLDPAYDRPPDPSYVCEICREAGKHFKSLCPHNRDPYCIYQKRKAKGIKTPPSNRGRVFREWEKDLDQQKVADSRERKEQEGRLTRTSSNASLGSSSPTLSSRNEKLDRLQEIEDLKVRLFNNESVDIDDIMGGSRFEGRDDNDRKRDRLHDQSSSTSRIASPAPSSVQGPRKKARATVSDDITSSPRMKVGLAETSVDTLRCSNESHESQGIDTEMVDAIASNNSPRIDRVGEDNTNPFYSTQFSLRPHKMNTDAMSVDERDTDSSEEMDIEVPKPPKKYSDFVQKLIQNRPDMSEVVNKARRRPTAVDMWKQDDQRRREQMTANVTEASLPSSPFSSEKEESNPSKSAELFAKPEQAQFDGACDERPVDENKDSQRKSSTIGENRPSPQRKISAIGKEAIEKVKELTTHVAKDLQTFKSKCSSSYGTSTSRSEELSPTKQRKKSPETTELLRISSGESLSSLRVNAASSTLNLTEENIRSLAQNTSQRASEGSEYSFGSLEVNLPGNSHAMEVVRKPVSSNPFSVYAGRQSLDATQNHYTNGSEATLREGFAETHRQQYPASGATDLPMHVDHDTLAGKLPALQEANAQRDGPTDMTSNTRVPTQTRTEPEKQDDESKAQEDVLERIDPADIMDET